MPITMLDGILLAVMLCFRRARHGARLFARGAFRRLLGGGGGGGLFLLPGPAALRAASTPRATRSRWSALPALIFLVVLIVISVITMRIADFIIDSRIGALDRTLGFVFGAARGLLLVVVAMLFFNWLVAPAQQPEWVSEAKSKPLINSLGAKLVSMLPENADLEALRQAAERQRQGQGDHGRRLWPVTGPAPRTHRRPGRGDFEV